MDFGIFVLVIVPFLIALFVVRFILRRERSFEEEYYRRLYWTVRQAREDANKDKENHDQN